jgi:hypothetical protein
MRTMVAYFDRYRCLPICSHRAERIFQTASVPARLVCVQQMDPSENRALCAGLALSLVGLALIRRW